jgi:pimeloyl-ACP methyl ester carboxylesterase
LRADDGRNLAYSGKTRLRHADVVEGQSMDLAEPAGLIHHRCCVSTGVKLHVVERPGQGRPILLLHGIWGMWRTWLSILDEPAPALVGRPTFAIDLRGHGFSDHPDTGYTLADYASDIIGLIDQLGVDQISLIGHSLGAIISLELIAKAPHRFDKIVLEEPPLPFPDENTPIEGFWQQFVEALIGFYILKHEPHEVIVAELMKAADWMTLELADEGAYYVSHTADGVFTAVMREEITLDSIECLAQPLPMPALIFQGSNLDDRALNDCGVAMLRKLLPNASVVTLPDTGHIVHASSPDAFQQAVVAFLASSS